MKLNHSAFHLFAVVEVASGQLLFASQQYTIAKKFYDEMLRSIFHVVHYPDIKKSFRLVKFDLNSRYAEDDDQPSFGSCLVNEIKQSLSVN